MLHTTGNSHIGGDSGGFLTASNNIMLSFVSSAEIPPTARGTATEMPSLFQSILTIITRHLIYDGMYKNIRTRNMRKNRSLKTRLLFFIKIC